MKLSFREGVDRLMKIAANSVGKIKLKRQALNLIVIGAMMIVGIVTNLLMGFSWFSNNRQTDAGNLSITTNAIYTDVKVYEYTGSELVPVSSLEFDMNPGDSKIVVFIVTRVSQDSTVQFNFSLSDISVCYYGLQNPGYFTSQTVLDNYLSQHRLAGTYSYGDPKLYIDPESITANDYLKFVKPVSNAVMVADTTCSITGDNAANDAAKCAYVAAQLNNNELAFSSANEPLYVSDNGITSDQILGNADSKITALDAGYFTPLTGGTVTTLNPITITDPVYAVALRFYFDESLGSTAVLDLNGDGTAETNVTLESSNPFMYQRFRIGKIILDGSES